MPLPCAGARFSWLPVEGNAPRKSPATWAVRAKLLGVGWQHAKHWITSPDPEYAREKNWRDALIALAHRADWAVGYLDEVWWSRVAQPSMHACSEVKQPLRLQELQVSKDDLDPKALSCYSMLDAHSGKIRTSVEIGRWAHVK